MKETLIKNFLRISKIPRMSGKEKKISDFFVQVAKDNNLYYFQDKDYNVLIKKKGNIEGDPIAFQAHLDMVCVKRENSNHDFNNDGIDVIIEGDLVKARDTSLGADQGVGLALMLTLIEDNTIKHPDLEFLFTVAEETTFKGAINFPYDKVSSKKMVNLDNSKDNEIVVGSAGDIANEYTYEGKLSEKVLDSYKLTINGLPGGNSGENIELSKNNAIITLIKELADKNIYLKSINGGTFENDMATYCEVVLQTDIDLYKELENSNIKIEKINNNLSFSEEDTRNIINEILALKSGYITKTLSGNLGIIKTIDNKVIITYLFRSESENELQEFSNDVKELNYNFDIKHLYSDPIWKLNEDSAMLKKYREVYYDLFKEKPLEIIMQAGLEVASIEKRLEGLDIISIGANMKNIHTVDEITYISSWKKVYNILVNFIKN